MNARDRRKTEAVLRALCVGTQIVGARWYAHSFFVALEPVPPHRGQHDLTDLTLSVESRWTVFPAPPEQYPTSEAELPDLSLEERLVALARLADQEIVAAALGADAPHLILTFDSGRVFFLNGAHAAYECWNLTTATAEPDKQWLIVAVPGGEIALFSPPGAAVPE
jgi:hypothetical protein